MAEQKEPKLSWLCILKAALDSEAEIIMNLVIGNEDTTGERKTNIRAPFNAGASVSCFPF